MITCLVDFMIETLYPFFPEHSRFFFLSFLFQYLYLESNELTSIPDDVFDKLPNLKWLDLRRNYLVRLPSVYTGRHQCLRNLLLEGNNLRTLPLELGKIYDKKRNNTATEEFLFTLFPHNKIWTCRN